MFREARLMANRCKYLDENNKENADENYHTICDNFKDLKLIEGMFRKRLFRKVREYLQTISSECRQSYVKLID